METKRRRGFRTYPHDAIAVQLRDLAPRCAHDPSELNVKAVEEHAGEPLGAEHGRPLIEWHW